MYHRGIKPENVLLTSDGDPAIRDFGIAVSEELLGTSATLAFPSLPMHSSAPGTARSVVHDSASYDATSSSGVEPLMSIAWYPV